MLKRSIAAIVAIFVVWQIFDFVVHGVLLMETYNQTAELWRPAHEMMRGLMVVVSLIASVCFVGVYALLVNPKTMAAGIKYGVIFGLGTGISMGYGSYSYMPIPYYLAFSWFVAGLVHAVVGGVLVGLIIKPPPSEDSETA